MDAQLVETKERVRLAHQVLDTSLLALPGDPNIEELVDVMAPKYGISYDPKLYFSYFEFVSSLMLVSMLETVFDMKKIELPNTLRVLDAGAGEWQYVNALHSFLSNYGEKRRVNLIGLDKIAEECNFVFNVRDRLPDSPIQYIGGEIENLDSLNLETNFDMVFMMRMLSSPEHFKKWGLPYISPAKMYAKPFEFLNPSGLLVGVAYSSDNEDQVLASMPGTEVAHYFHDVDLSVARNLFARNHSFDENIIKVTRKE